MTIGNAINGIEKMEGLIVLRNEPMARHTTLRVGGPVTAHVTVFSTKALEELIRYLNQKAIPYLIVGGGSNIVWPDRESDVVVLDLSGLRYIKKIEPYTVIASAGLPLLNLVRFTVREGLKGIEGLFGIPGTVGGAIKGNAGAFGYEIKDCLSSVKIVSRDGEFREIKRDELKFQYRGSSIGDDEIIVEATFRFKKGESEELSTRIRQYLYEKRQRQPLNLPSAGCVFKNPPQDFAGRLIDEAGCKGLRVGGMEVSTIHANFIVNRAGGSAGDFLRLMEMVQERVMKRFNTMLEPEVKVIKI